MGIIGLILWNKPKKELPITKCTSKERFVYTAIIIISTFTLYTLLKQTKDPKPLIDAFTTSSSFVATYYMVKRNLDTWILWFINDISYSIQYALLQEPAYYLMVLNIIWTFMAIASYIKWQKIMIGEKL
jgi:nicotinamide mononucleotide transporter PnuC